MIGEITIWHGDQNHAPETYCVGLDGVTQIEECTKPGMHADIPYVRVWKGETAFAEFCQHNIVGVYFRSTLACRESGE